jgi:hypothetical protein
VLSWLHPPNEDDRLDAMVELLAKAAVVRFVDATPRVYMQEQRDEWHLDGGLWGRITDRIYIQWTEILDDLDSAGISQA